MRETTILWTSFLRAMLLKFFKNDPGGGELMINHGKQIASKCVKDFSPGPHDRSRVCPGDEYRNDWQPLTRAMDDDGAIMASRRSASSVMMTIAIVIAIRRSIAVAGIVVRAMMPVTRVGMGRAISVTRVGLRGTMAITASGLTKAMRRARSPMWWTDGLLSILVEDRHAIVVLHDGAAIFAILVHKYRRTAVFDGRSEVLSVRSKYRRRLSEGRSRA